MARITVEDCIDKFDSRFELVLVASNRARKLHSGENPTVEKNNDKNTVIALREIADETISADAFKENLIEEYQTISPIDEEELALEFNDENIDEVTESEVVSDASLETEAAEATEELKEEFAETNEDETSSGIGEIETDHTS